MTLHTLRYGKSKKRMKEIMTDSLRKCQNYQRGRETAGVPGFHEIVPAAPDATKWKQPIWK